MGGGSDPVISHINPHIRRDEWMVEGGEGWWRGQGGDRPSHQPH